MSNFFNEKRSILGINKNIFCVFNKKCGLNCRSEPSFFKKKQLYKFNTIVTKNILDKKLKENVKDNIFYLIQIKSYKGIRHKQKYPTRGQRTHTNAKTRKKNL